MTNGPRPQASWAPSHSLPWNQLNIWNAILENAESTFVSHTILNLSTPWFHRLSYRYQRQVLSFFSPPPLWKDMLEIFYVHACNLCRSGKRDFFYFLFNHGWQTWDCFHKRKFALIFKNFVLGEIFKWISVIYFIKHEHQITWDEYAGFNKSWRGWQ